MRICAHAHMRTCAHARMRACTHMSRCAHAHVHMHMRTCTCTCARAHARAHVRQVDEYAAHGQQIIVGEWSIATNHDEPRDLTDPETVRELTKLYQEHLHMFNTKAPAVLGHFYWTLRMGSGWDPRPSETHPRGRQVEGTSPSRSLPGFPFRVWSLLEMASLGIATPFDRSYEGACAD